MRTTLFTLIFCFTLLTVQAQVPNGSFENWSYVTNSLLLDGWQVNNGMLPDTKVAPDTQYVCLDSLSMQVGPGGAASTGFSIDSTIKSISFCLTAIIDTPDTVNFYILTYSAGVRIDSIPSLINTDIGPLFDINLGFNETTPLDSVYVLFTGGSKLGTSMWVDDMRVDTAIVNSVKEPIRFGDMQVYPNPATNVVMLDIPGQQIQAVQVFDIQGQEVQQPVTGNQNTLDVSTLQPGMYFVICTDEAGAQYSQRFVKR